MASSQGHARAHRRDQGDAEDHQGHADGRGLEAAARAGGGRGRASLCRAHGARCSAISRRPLAISARRRELLSGTGSDRVHLLVVCTAERGLCGPFNSAIVRLARERANALIGEGKEVKFFCVGRKGYEQLRRNYDKQIIEHLELRAVRTHRVSSMRRRSASRSCGCTTRARSTSARCSSRASSR